MKVLYLLRYYPTLTETFVYREITALQARGVEVAVASLGERSDGALQDELPAVTVLRVPRRPLAGRLSGPTEGGRWLRAHQRSKDAARLPWLARRAAAFDHVHVHFAGEAAEWACALHRDTGLPYTVTVHAVDLFRPRPSLVEVLQAAAGVVTVADFHVQHLRGLGVTARRIRCGPDLAASVPSPLPDGPLRALCVARDVPKKGIDDLLAAWREARLPQARLVLVSDRTGPLPDGVECRGLLPPGQVRAELDRANLSVLACRRAPDGDMDGVPVVLMEAMAAGRPVLTTAVSGIPELVDETVGWLCPPGDPAALARALGAATDPRQRSLRGASGPARLRERGFTIDQQAEGLLSCWNAVHLDKL